MIPNKEKSGWNAAISYRPEIDGLRAIAVISVILFHLKVYLFEKNIFPGGFLGVDVFFVISGYLIGSIILKELGRDSFSFLRFYERRVRRLLPALLTVIIVSFPFARNYILPKEMMDFAWSVISSLTFSSNFYFLFQGNYWTESGLLRPLLHTWSLAVEEQFYIVIPFLFFLIWKHARNKTLRIFSALTFSSFICALILSKNHPDSSFYLTVSRSWELGIGIILALLENEKGRRIPVLAGKILPLVGTAMIVVSFLIFDENSPHPSYPTLLPVLGTAIVLWFSTGRHALDTILSNKLFVSIGLISYSLYLWHYPIFAFGRIMRPDSNLQDNVIWLLLTLILATLTYHFVEKPFRWGRISTNKFLVISSVLSAILILLSCSIIIGKGMAHRYPAGTLVSSLTHSIDYNTNRDYLIGEYQSVKDKDFIDDGRPRVLLIGDSYSEDFYNMLSENHLLNEVQLVAFYIRSGCKNVLSSREDLKDKLGKNTELCKNTVRIGDKTLDSKIKQADAVIIATKWETYTGKNSKELQEYVKGMGIKKVMVVGGKSFPKLNSLSANVVSLSQVINFRDRVDKGAYRTAELMENLDLDYYIDIFQLACSNTDTCPITTPDGEMMSWDGDHLTQAGATYVGSLLKNDETFRKFWQWNTN